MTERAAEMNYVIFVSGKPGLLLSPLAQEEEDYVREVILPILRPLSAEEYMAGPAAILHTMARWSYVLVGDDLLWCVEWDPGLLVIRVRVSDGALSWCALRSPNPEFGGRIATDEEIAAFDEDARNPQYELIFVPWDAQNDPTERDDFSEATSEPQARIRQAVAHLNHLGDELRRRIGDDFDGWFERCKQSTIWRGPDA